MAIKAPALSSLIPALAGGVGGPGAAIGVRLRLLGSLEVLLVRLLDHRQGDAHVLREILAGRVELHDLTCCKNGRKSTMSLLWYVSHAVSLLKSPLTDAYVAGSKNAVDRVANSSRVPIHASNLGFATQASIRREP